MGDWFTIGVLDLRRVRATLELPPIVSKSKNCFTKHKAARGTAKDAKDDVCLVLNMSHPKIDEDIGRVLSPMTSMNKSFPSRAIILADVCRPGRFLSEAAVEGHEVKTCEECPIGKYQPQFGSVGILTCFPCGTLHTTL